MDPIHDNSERPLADSLNSLAGLAEVRSRLRNTRVWLVGGAVRDLLLGAARADLDIAVEGSAASVAAALGADVRAHERFGTASVGFRGVRVDVASTRRETYAAPGALPDVVPASLDQDLTRRDFTVNAMAIPLFGEPRLIDPYGGAGDLEARLLRVLHDQSFEDDPTRALRAARYAARLGFELEPRTAELLSGADLGSASADRVDAELRRLLREDRAVDAVALLAEWDLAGIDPGAVARVEATRVLLDDPVWAGLVPRSSALLDAVRTPDSPDPRPAPATASAGAKLAAGTPALELLRERRAGAQWLDQWAREWRQVELEIDGADLIEAGVAEGPAIGRGLDAALAAKLDGETGGRHDELRIALAAAS
ncbi:hypothetical protein BH24ACT23_BH24ACT23_01530 [soil metagenome]